MVWFKLSNKGLGSWCNVDDHMSIHGLIKCHRLNHYKIAVSAKHQCLSDIATIVPLKSIDSNYAFIICYLLVSYSPLSIRMLKDHDLHMLGCLPNLLHVRHVVCTEFSDSFSNPVPSSHLSCVITA